MCKLLTSSYPKISIRGTADNLLIVASWCSTTDFTPLSLTGDKILRIYAEISHSLRGYKDNIRKEIADS
jgi:hypothetical protein